MIRDVLIIGAGPSGLYAWKSAKDLGLTVHIIESNSIIGGQVTNSYPSKIVNNVPGVVNTTGLELINTVSDSIKKEEDLFLETEILSISEEQENNTNIFCIKLSNNKIIRVKYILITEGYGRNEPIKLFDKEFQNVFYRVNDEKIYKNKNLIIFGGGDSAADWAIHFKDICKNIKIVHRRHEFRFNQRSLDAITNNNIELIKPYALEKYNDSKNNIDSIELKDLENENNSLKLDADIILVQFGSKINTNKFNYLSVKRNEVGRIIVDNSFKTNVDNVYAAGDCCQYENKVRNLLGSFNDSYIAILNIYKKLNSKENLQRGW